LFAMLWLLCRDWACASLPRDPGSGFNYQNLI
jgi:hypothetical protein